MTLAYRNKLAWPALGYVPINPGNRRGRHG